ncbi:MAG: phosphatidylserine synthase [Flavobacteriaceae bacterium]|nr:phosphatidylserine synthase [Flavobacteriaceae bacterium]
MKALIPNLITLLNLFFGTIAVIFAVEGALTMAAFFVLLGIFFDFFDGFLARKLNVASALGLQLDSLADMVTSGLVPGLIMFQLISQSLTGSEPYVDLLPYMGLLITLGSAYRLANFNISTEQKNYFIGLPTPANALLVLSFPLILEYQNNEAFNSVILNAWFLLALTLISTFLLNAPVKLMALKFKTWKFSDNIEKYILLILALIFLMVFKFFGISLIIFSYLLISVIKPPNDA